jgi:hypothetical protein
MYVQVYLINLFIYIVWSVLRMCASVFVGATAIRVSIEYLYERTQDVAQVSGPSIRTTKYDESTIYISEPCMVCMKYMYECMYV